MLPRFCAALSILPPFPSASRFLALSLSLCHFIILSLSVLRPLPSFSLVVFIYLSSSIYLPRLFCPLFLSLSLSFLSVSHSFSIPISLSLCSSLTPSLFLCYLFFSIPSPLIVYVSLPLYLFLFHFVFFFVALTILLPSWRFRKSSLPATARSIPQCSYFSKISKTSSRRDERSSRVRASV